MPQFSWIINEQLKKSQPSIPLRMLLHDQWLLPSRFVHFLRIRKNVLVNGNYINMNQVVHAGDQVQLRFCGDEFRTAHSNYIPTANPHLQILFENRDILVVNKPAGQKTHPNQPEETGTLLNDVAGYLQDSGHGAYMVHRLDQQTSGALIVAKNPVVVPILDRLIANDQIHRIYWAVVQGEFKTSSGDFTEPIGRDPLDKRKRKVNGKDAKKAITHYRVLNTIAGKSLVELRLETGRTHQLRVHLAANGHPIVGDPLYNPISEPHMLLHGVKQQLILPFEQSLKQIYAPLPNYFPRALVKYDQKTNKGDINCHF